MLLKGRGSASTGSPNTPRQKCNAGFMNIPRYVFFCFDTLLGLAYNQNCLIVKQRILINSINEKKEKTGYDFLSTRTSFLFIRLKDPDISYSSSWKNISLFFKGLMRALHCQTKGSSAPTFFHR